MNTTRPPPAHHDYQRMYPRICAHIICESLGYATPTTAAQILKHAHNHTPDYCEWIATCYHTNARHAVRDAIRRRHQHRGYMADYRTARAIINNANTSGDEPHFASWF